MSCFWLVREMLFTFVALLHLFIIANPEIVYTLPGQITINTVCFFFTICKPSVVPQYQYFTKKSVYGFSSYTATILNLHTEQNKPEAGVLVRKFSQLSRSAKLDLSQLNLRRLSLAKPTKLNFFKTPASGRESASLVWNSGTKETNSKYINIFRVPQCPFVGIGTLPPPLPQASVPPLRKR